MTLELRLPEPVAHIPYLFAQLPFFPWPRHKLEELGADGTRRRARGNGPFALLDAHDERAVFTRNPHWSSTNVRSAEVDQIRDPSRRGTSGEAGRLDFVFSPELHLADYPDGDILLMSALSTQYVAFSDHAPFDDVRVRRALAHGIDRAPPVHRRHGERSGARRVLPPAMPGHSHDLAPSYDIDRAKRSSRSRDTRTAEACQSFASFRPTRARPGRPPRRSRRGGNLQWRELGVRCGRSGSRFDEVPAEGRGRPVVLGLGLGERLPRSGRNARYFLASMPATRRRAVERCSSGLRCATRRDERSSSIARPTAGSLPNPCGWCRRSTTSGSSCTARTSRGCGRIRWDQPARRGRRSSMSIPSRRRRGRAPLLPGDCRSGLRGCTQMLAAEAARIFRPERDRRRAPWLGRHPRRLPREARPASAPRVVDLLDVAVGNEGVAAIQHATARPRQQLDITAC